MLKRFYPDAETENAYEIDYAGFCKMGCRGVIFDVDNTLVPHGAPADERAIALFEKLHGLGLGTVLLSNNKEPRVKSFARQVGSDYIFRAGKPPLLCRQALRSAALSPSAPYPTANLQNHLVPRPIPALASSRREIPAGNTPRQAINAVFRKNLDFSS